MTLVYDRRSAMADDEPQLHALVIGCGRFPHFDGDVNRKACTDSAVAMVELLLKHADRFEAKLASIELLLSDPDVNKGEDRFHALPEHDPRADPALPVERRESVEPACEDEVTVAYEAWFARCRSDRHDPMLFYGCSHGLADRDSEGLMVLEDVKSRTNKWRQVLNVSSMASGLPIHFRPGAAWFFLDACQELLTDIVDQIRGVVGIQPVPVTATERREYNMQGGARPLVMGTDYGLRTYAGKEGVAFFTQALLEGIERYCFEPRGARHFITGRKLAQGVPELSLSLFRRELRIGGFGNDNAQIMTALCEVAEPQVVFHISWDTQPRGLIDVAPLGLHAAGDPSEVLAMRENDQNGDVWIVSRKLPAGGVTLFLREGADRIENTIPHINPPVIRHEVYQP